jgi:hypothetical protein
MSYVSAVAKLNMHCDWVNLRTTHALKIFFKKLIIKLKNLQYYTALSLREPSHSNWKRKGKKWAAAVIAVSLSGSPGQRQLDALLRLVCRLTQHRRKQVRRVPLWMTFLLPDVHTSAVTWAVMVWPKSRGFLFYVRSQTSTQVEVNYTAPPRS